MRPKLVAGLVALAVLLPMAGGYTVSFAEPRDEAPPLGPGVVTVELDTRYSRFSIDHLRVYQGTLVRFVVTNRDYLAFLDDLLTSDPAAADRFAPRDRGRTPNTWGDVIYLREGGHHVLPTMPCTLGVAPVPIDAWPVAVNVLAYGRSAFITIAPSRSSRPMPPVNSFCWRSNTQLGH